MKMPIRNFIEAEQESKTLSEPIQSGGLKPSKGEFVLLRVGIKF
jgi:hypothetical protein